MLKKKVKEKKIILSYMNSGGKYGGAMHMVREMMPKIGEKMPSSWKVEEFHIEKAVSTPT